MGVTNTTRNRNATPSQKIVASEAFSQLTEQSPKYNDGESDDVEFGGSLGAASLMIGFPLLMWYMWIGATYYDGKFPLPNANQTWGDFAHHLAHLVYEGAYPTAKAWTVYWTFFVWQAIMFVISSSPFSKNFLRLTSSRYCYMPGVMGKGKPLRHEGGKQLPYYCSAYTSWCATLATATVLHVTGIFPLNTLIDEFGSIMTVAILSGFLNSIIVYVRAIARGRTHRLTGYPIYDFFMGAELNPRIGILDFKMFYEVRIPWFILFFITASVAVRQYENYGYVSIEVMFLLMAHFIYAHTCAKAEQLIITSW